MQEESKEENNQSRRGYSFRKASVEIWIQSGGKEKEKKDLGVLSCHLTAGLLENKQSDKMVLYDNQSFQPFNKVKSSPSVPVSNSLLLFLTISVLLKDLKVKRASSHLEDLPDVTELQKRKQKRNLLSHRLHFCII